MQASLVLIVTHPMTARYLLRGQAEFLSGEGFEVTVISSPGPELSGFRDGEGVAVVAIPMSRRSLALADLRALWQLLRALRRIRPDIVTAGTPKAGLLGMLAAWLARVPMRVQLARGLPLETARGVWRAALVAAERLTGALAQHIVCVSPSLRDRYLELGLAPAAKLTVLAHGSSNGVDLDRFHPAEEGPEIRELLRSLGIPESAPVIGFVGRFTVDKGIEDLATAFLDIVAPRHADCRLLLIGGFESGDPVSPAVRRRLESEPRVVFAGFVEDSAPFYRVMDLLTLPSYREGLPNAPLEAAASGLPTVGYAATGTVDAVADSETGVLVAVGDVEALGSALCAQLDHPEWRRRLGTAARARVAERYGRELVWRAWAREYRRLLTSRSPGD